MKELHKYMGQEWYFFPYYEAPDRMNLTENQFLLLHYLNSNTNKMKTVYYLGNKISTSYSGVENGENLTFEKYKKVLEFNKELRKVFYN